MCPWLIPLALVMRETNWENEEEIQKGIYLLQEKGFPC